MRLAIASVVVHQNDGNVALTTTSVLVAALHPDSITCGDGHLPVVGDAVAGRIPCPPSWVTVRRMTAVALVVHVCAGGHDISDSGGMRLTK